MIIEQARSLACSAVAVKKILITQFYHADLFEMREFYVTIARVGICDRKKRYEMCNAKSAQERRWKCMLRRAPFPFN